MRLLLSIAFCIVFCLAMEKIKRIESKGARYAITAALFIFCFMLVGVSFLYFLLGMAIYNFLLKKFF